MDPHDRLEASIEGAAHRWEVRGDEVVLHVVLPRGRMEVTTRGERCQIRLQGLEPEELRRLIASLAPSP